MPRGRAAATTLPSPFCSPLHTAFGADNVCASRSDTRPLCLCARSRVGCPGPHRTPSTALRAPRALAWPVLAGPLHSMVLLGACDDVEEDLLASFCVASAAAEHYDAAALKTIDLAAAKAANAHEGVVGDAEESDDDEAAAAADGAAGHE
eukprot:3871335-Prymnesium_polylepis.1